MNIDEQLQKAGIHFETEWIYTNQFHGNRYIFNTLDEAMKAEKLLKAIAISYRHKYAIDIFN